EWQDKDPIPRFEAQVVEAGLLTAEDVAAVRDEVVATLRAAVREANSAPDADPSDLLDSVFAKA
ncbi:MAG: acetoin:2,6-dichlorophenolindophenol oxidoreductase subunit alpha, partial [Nocardioidaceae bacterium]|nr:acetoin:2,6-dichlorophenolindophenol oxidoreductase subunit alpha [Nocardioidaceae bacterium]